MSSENEPLIPSAEYETVRQDPHILRNRIIVWSALAVLFIVAVVVALVDPGFISDFGLSGKLPRDPELAAQRLLNIAPVIDGHIDLPMVARFGWRNNVTDVPLDSQMPMHVDIPRLREGKVGGFFWSVYVSCASPEDEGADFLKASWRVRDTLEQIDVAKGLISKYPHDFAYAVSSSDIKLAITNRKIASILGVEGAHQLGNSIAVLRQYYELGVRYVTLTHTCHNAFADSCGMLQPSAPRHYGLSPLGFKLVEEMNRLGMLVDLSHTSDMTATQALLHSKAPVIWSHSSARAIHNVARNVPDEVLSLVGFGEGQRDAVVMVNFNGPFVADDGEADIEAVADHIEHIAKVAGVKHVGIGSDYDGISVTPKGLEDVSKYPALIAELYRRGWSKLDLAGLTGGNFLRVFEGAEKVAKDLQAAGTLPKYDVYDKREDLPVLREL
ncbi:membrane dipeptidase-domain-containing protein [Suillus paluster]|uniref:membrane dipeptidase-domain-containing protein n=1 Tax=Suillus paluster TaxID=48578 RepID=UPI001B86A15E|nr:membrane dipeptidase-domain-containing protein [Suillus paluster]KAG1745536.1 membrane dipeptidase-domain-containing protein [Suillus paluster]